MPEKIHPSFDARCTDRALLLSVGGHSYGQVAEGVDDIEGLAAGFMLAHVADALMEVADRLAHAPLVTDDGLALTGAPLRPGLHAFRIDLGDDFDAGLGTKLVVAVRTGGWSMPSNGNKDVRFFQKLILEREPTDEEVAAELKNNLRTPAELFLWSSRAASSAWKALSDPDAAEPVLTALMHDWSRDKTSALVFKHTALKESLNYKPNNGHFYRMATVTRALRSALRAAGLEASTSAVLRERINGCTPGFSFGKGGAVVKGLERSAALDILTRAALKEDGGWIGASVGGLVQDVINSQMTLVIRNLVDDLAAIGDAQQALASSNGEQHRSFNDGRTDLYAFDGSSDLGTATQHGSYRVAVGEGQIRIDRGGPDALRRRSALSPWVLLTRTGEGSWMLTEEPSLDTIRNLNDLTGAFSSIRCCMEEEVAARSTAPSAPAQSGPSVMELARGPAASDIDPIFGG